MGRNTVFARLLVPATLLAASVALFVAGAEGPRWIARLGSLAGVVGGPERSMRAAAAVGLAVALCAAFLGRGSHSLARFGAVLLACAGLATVAGAKGPAGIGWIAIGAGSIAAAAGGASAIALSGAAEPTRSPRRRAGPSDAWRVLACVGLTTAAFAFLAAAPSTRPASSGGRTFLSADGSEFVDLEFRTWEGRPLSETPLAKHLPQLVADAARGTVHLVFHSPHCGSCHALFARHYASPRAERVYAIEVPTSPDAVLAAGDDQEIDCPLCLRATLPVGIGWLVTPPTVVVVDDGVVRCVQEPRSGKSCLGE